MRDASRALAVAAALLALASPAFALTPASEHATGAIAPDAVKPVVFGNTARQAALHAKPEWQGFRARHGAWTASWNEATGSPHRAFGPSIALAGVRNDAESVDRAVRSFIAGNPGVFGTPTLEPAAVQRARGMWYVRYRQTIDGVPVLFSDWEFRVSDSGKLVAFGADAREGHAALGTSGQLVRAVAREASHQGLSYRPGVDRVEDGDTWLLPWNTANGTELRLVYEQSVRTQDPPGNWWTLVDAHTGDVLWRHNRVRHVISGQATGTIHPVLPTDPLVSAAFPNLSLDVGGTHATTNALGNYSAAASGTVTVSASLSGPYCIVSNDVPPPAAFSTSATNPATVNIVWNAGNSVDAERDAFYHVNAAHDFVVSVDPAFTGMNYAMPTRVNINATCNAFWDGVGVNFYAAGGGCPNTASIADVVYHEYGHGINDNLYITAGSPAGMMSGALHEGLADVTATLMQDNPNIGKGFSGVGTILRTVDNTNRYPENDGESHFAGLIIGGTFWDLRQAIGLPLTVDLAHFAKYGTPDDVGSAGIAMNEYFVETLIADDNDANLANGTPHFNAIVDAFNAHGIGTGFFISFTHTPIADQIGPGNYPVTAVIQYNGPVGSLDAGSPTLHYTINDGAEQTTPMTPTGNPNEFRGFIPGQAAAIVHYWMTAEDTYNASVSNPPVAPARGTYVFLAGAASPVFLQTMQTDPGWLVGAPGDNATVGTWNRGNPNGTFVDGLLVAPEDDHTPGSGTVCWVTGIGIAGEQPGVNDVDNGRTTLTTHTFDATSAGVFPVIEYYRWFTNALGSSPNSDYWRTLISNDAGASWVAVENTLVSDNSWKRILFFIHDYVTPTNQMQMRFVAQDSAAGSLVEAGVDDFRLLVYPPSASIADGVPSLAGAFALAPPSPNPAPFKTTMRFTLPAASRAALRVYDLGGRFVRTLTDGALAAGPHAVEWNGRDEGGRLVAAGPYFVRLMSEGREAVRKVMLVR